MLVYLFFDALWSKASLASEFFFRLHGSNLFRKLCGLFNYFCNFFWKFRNFFHTPTLNVKRSCAFFHSVLLALAQIFATTVYMLWFSYFALAPHARLLPLFALTTAFFTSVRILKENSFRHCGWLWLFRCWGTEQQAYMAYTANCAFVVCVCFFVSFFAALLCYFALVASWFVRLTSNASPRYVFGAMWAFVKLN